MINSDNVLLPSQKKKKRYKTLIMNFKNRMMSESSFPQKNANCMIPLIWKQANIYGEINPFIMGQVQRLMGKGNERTFSGDRNVHFDRCLGYTGDVLVKAHQMVELICVFHLCKKYRLKGLEWSKPDIPNLL